MAASQLIATGSTAASSSDVTIVAGSPITVGLKGVVDAKARVPVELKDDAGAYNVIGELTSAPGTAYLGGPGVYRFTRVAGGTCGVFTG